MKPLIVLLITFAISLVGMKLLSGKWDFVLSGNIAMCLMLGFTAIGHFAFTKGMEMMIPGVIPVKKQLVYFTGVFEVVCGIGILLSEFRHICAICLIVFFIIVFPTNIYAAIKHVDYEKGTYEGKGTGYLWFRVPLQILFIGWVYFFSLYLKE
jgi:uncharacterized membrane protein